jgi:hypothetical protein
LIKIKFDKLKIPNIQLFSETMLSLYIPIIQDNITETYIKRQFNDHNIGKVMRVDFVKNISKNRREAFVHFDEWFDNETSRAMQDDIKNPDTKTRFIYHDKKFFPLLVNKNAHRRVNNPEYEVLKAEDIKSAAKMLVSIPMDISSSNEFKRPRITNKTSSPN